MMTDTQFRDTIKTLLAAFGSNDPAQRQEARAKIRNTLAANRKSWNDLMAILHFGGKHGEKLKKLFAIRSAARRSMPATCRAAGHRHQARRNPRRAVPLRRHRCRWRDRPRGRRCRHGGERR